MNSQTLEIHKNTLLRQRQLLVYACGFLGVLLILLSLSNLFLIGRERIVVVPAVVTNKFWVAVDSVSDSYLEQMADFWGGLLLSANETNFQVRAAQLLEHTDPDSYSAVKAMLTEQQKVIEQRGISTSFTAQSFQIDKGKLLVLVKGYLKSMVANQLVETTEKQFQMEFSVKNGRFYVKKFEDVKND
jgi:conjugal transfer pilus assembly protein TraE